MIGYNYDKESYKRQKEIWENKGMRTFSGMLPTDKKAKNKVFFWDGEYITHTDMKRFNGTVIRVESKITNDISKETAIDWAEHSVTLEKIKKGCAFKVKKKKTLEQLELLLDTSSTGILLDECIMFDGSKFTYTPKEQEITNNELLNMLKTYRNIKYATERKRNRAKLTKIIGSDTRAKKIFKQRQTFFADNYMLEQIVEILELRVKKRGEGVWVIDNNGGVVRQKDTIADIGYKEAKKIINEMYEKTRTKRVN